MISPLHTITYKQRVTETCDQTVLAWKDEIRHARYGLSQIISAVEAHKNEVRKAYYVGYYENSAPMNNHFTTACPNHVQFSQKGVASHLYSSQWRNDAGSNSDSTVKFSLVPNNTSYDMESGHVVVHSTLKTACRVLDQERYLSHGESVILGYTRESCAIYSDEFLRAAVVKWLDYPSPTKSNRVPGGESCRIVPPVGGFSRGSPVSSTLRGAVLHWQLLYSNLKRRPNLFTHSRVSPAAASTCLHLVPKCGVTVTRRDRRINGSRLEKLHFTQIETQFSSGSIPGGVARGISHLGIVPGDAAGRRVFSGISRFPRPCIPVLLHTSLHTHRLSTPWLIHIAEILRRPHQPNSHTISPLHCHLLCDMVVYRIARNFDIVSLGILPPLAIRRRPACYALFAPAGLAHHSYSSPAILNISCRQTRSVATVASLTRLRDTSSSQPWCPQVIRDDFLFSLSQYWLDYLPPSLGESGSITGGVTPGFSSVGIVLGFSRPRPAPKCISRLNTVRLWGCGQSSSSPVSRRRWSCSLHWTPSPGSQPSAVVRPDTVGRQQPRVQRDVSTSKRERDRERMPCSLQCPGYPAGRRVFSVISRSLRPCIPALIHAQLASHSPALKNSIYAALAVTAGKRRGSVFLFTTVGIFVETGYSTDRWIAEVKESACAVLRQVDSCVLSGEVLWFVYTRAGRALNLKFTCLPRAHCELYRVQNRVEESLRSTRAARCFCNTAASGPHESAAVLKVGVYSLLRRRTRQE
ncbi:hypothetical protein PR048_008028 [Dryococelus australis]|uniref:Uncharacterized protein n=1 Tax=Dryococelus australis TaxID=614101 RepID=A0ABQ9HVY2_9NEOP|nr:hypothetical protein PR048_008028 [Dryococelus australis]